MGLWRTIFPPSVQLDEDGQATNIKIFSFSRPHMRSLHLSWMCFFLAFTGWFALPPLTPSLRATIGVTSSDVSNANLTAVSATIAARVVVGPLCDRFGPKRVMALILILGAIPVGLSGLISDGNGLVITRFFIGVLGASFVVCQFWVTQLFAPEIVGTANALAAGWGNMGGGLTNLSMPLVFDLLHMWVSVDHAWRLTLVLPAVLCFLAALAAYLLGDDSPQGKWSDFVIYQQGRDAAHQDMLMRAEAMNAAAERSGGQSIELQMSNVDGRFEPSRLSLIGKEYWSTHQHHHVQSKAASQDRRLTATTTTTAATWTHTDVEDTDDDDSSSRYGFGGGERRTKGQKSPSVFTIDTMTTTDSDFAQNPPRSAHLRPTFRMSRMGFPVNKKSSATAGMTPLPKVAVTPDSAGGEPFYAFDNTCKSFADQQQQLPRHSVAYESAFPISPPSNPTLRPSTNSVLTRIWHELSTPAVLILMLQYATCFGLELAIDNIVAEFFHLRFNLSQTTAGMLGSIFGFINLFSRLSGGIFGDWCGAQFGEGGTQGRLLAQWIVLTCEGITLIFFGFAAHDLTLSVVALVLFSFFVQAACGSSFSVVPFVNPRSQGIVFGLVGAGGNIGGLMFSYVFKYYGLDYESAFFCIGGVVLAAAGLTLGLKVQSRMLLGLVFKKLNP